MDRTAVWASEFNRLRRRRGPAGDLVALHFTGETGEGVDAYEALKIYAEAETVNGWRATTARGDDGAHFTRIKIADVDGQLATLVDGKLTDFAIGPTVYKLELDMTERPITAPFVWTFRAQVNTKDTYSPAEVEA
jgi:hypothetical protein